MLDFAVAAQTNVLVSESSSSEALTRASAIPLQRLRVGQRGCITALTGRVHDVARLAEMGLRRGAEVTVLRNGITCILQLDGNRLCIRLSKDLMIFVAPF